MVGLVTAIVQLLILVFKGWSDWSAEKRKENADKREGWKEIAKSGDLSAITAFNDRLRQ